MMDDFDGRTVVDPDGHKIGSVERSYVDDRGAVRFVEVKIGTLFAKHRFIPADGTDYRGQEFRVPYSKDVVEHSPDASGPADSVDGDTLVAVQRYYDQNTPGIDHGSGDSSASRLIGAESSTEASQASVQDGGAGVGTERIAAILADGRPIGEVRDLGDVIEIPILGERMVKQVYVKEVLRVRKSRVTERDNGPADGKHEVIDSHTNSGASLRDNA